MTAEGCICKSPRKERKVGDSNIASPTGKSASLLASILMSSWHTPANRKTEYAKRTGETERAINKQITTIKLMKVNKDRQRDNWSYYDVLVTNRDIKKHFENSPELKKFILKKIKQQKESGEEFTARNMRGKLPDVLKKSKILNKFMAGEETLEDAYMKAKVRNALKDAKNAHDYLKRIDRKALANLEQFGLGAVEQEVRRCKKEVIRLEKAIESVRESNMGAKRG